MSKSVLLQFRAGLGDAVQLQIIIRHLRYYNPHLTIGVECREPLTRVFNGVADAVHIMERPFEFRKNYEQVLYMPWELIQGESWAGVPSTKPTLCLERYFPQMPADPALYFYEMHPTEDAIERVQKYIHEELNDQPYGIVHYEGTHSPETKNLTDLEAGMLCDQLMQADIVPVVLSWSGWNNPLAKLDWVKRPSNGHWLWENKLWSHADTMFELIDHAEIMFGIDSGPEHLAGASSTPTEVFTFSDKFPARCFDLCPNITYHVHHSAMDWVPEETMNYFLQNYNHLWMECDPEIYISNMQWADEDNKKTPVENESPQELLNEIQI